jgi:hypothetical protein
MPICPACRGQKKIQGMGFMGEVDCKTCKGTGLEPVVVKTLEIRPADSSMNQTLEFKQSDTWSDTALIMQGDVIGKTETLELAVETHESILANLGKETEPQETKLERFKRKYTKSSK